LLLLLCLSIARLSTRSILFPYTTLFRSNECVCRALQTARVKRETHQSLRLRRRSPSPSRASPLSGLRPVEPFMVEFAAGSEAPRSEEHTSELQSRVDLVCRLLLEKKNTR